MRVCLWTFMCGGLPGPPKQYNAICWLTSSNNASSESGLDNRLIDYVNRLWASDYYGSRVSSSQEKMKHRIVSGSFASNSVLYICRKLVPSVRRLLLAAKQTIRKVSAHPLDGSTVVFSNHLSHLQFQIQISHWHCWLSESASHRCTTAPQSNPSWRTYFTFFYFVLGRRIFFCECAF